MIRAMKPEDLPDLKEMHDEFYKEEFPFPDFGKHFLGAFVCTNDDNRIISAGGLRTITEGITIMDQSLSLRERRDAMVQILHASMFTADRFNYDQIHAFVQQEKWSHILKKMGFTNPVGESLVLKF